ncbi:MAG: RNA-guided pseudouridylation complex pseudouridine synthase subunit Cbf5 [Candidatus Brocadiaceae bacterium]
MARHVKREAPTDPAFGCRPENRPLEEYLQWGVVPLDKPSGPTSRAACDMVGRLLGVDRTGHGGTLDPRVTGVLPVLLGHSTRVAGVLLGCDKAYVGTMLLHGDVAPAQLEEGLEQFRGVIEQVPPRRSSVRRRLRRRTVYRFDLVERDGRAVRFYVECEGGTYIRKLVHDLGEHLGCGAQMTELRRTEAAGLGVDQCVTTERLAEAFGAARDGHEDSLRRTVLPVERVLSRLLPGVWVDDGAVQSLCTGYPLTAPGVCALDDFGAGELVAVMTLKDELIGLGKARADSSAVLAAEAGPIVSMERVLMDQAAYPKWRREEG